eukprot:654114-Prorocentrum_minimum.AAC.2
MGKKVKQFIDKKNAATYQLMSRPSEHGPQNLVGPPAEDDPRMFVRTDTVRPRFPRRPSFG